MNAAENVAHKVQRQSRLRFASSLLNTLVSRVNRRHSMRMVRVCAVSAWVVINWLPMDSFFAQEGMRSQRYPSICRLAVAGSCTVINTYCMGAML